MFVINGKIITIPDPLKSLSSDNIDRINVLKGASAVTLYGAKGVNGVVEIFTKSKPLSPLKETTETANSNHLGEIVLVAPKQNGEEKEANEPIFTMAENNPTFPGGDSAWKTDDYPSSKTAKQCVNMIKTGPKWVPAIQNGT